MGTTTVTRTTPALHTASVESTKSRQNSQPTVPSQPHSLSTKISSPTRAVSTSTQLEALLVATLSSLSATALRTVRTTGSLPTPGTTPGEIKELSRSFRATAELTVRSTLVLPLSEML